MKLVNTPSYINEYVINYINGILTMTKEEDFSEEVFNDWLVIKDIEQKNNPNAYLKSCFKKELDNGTFKPKAIVNYVPNTQVLINALRDKGVCVLADESVWLSVVWQNILNNNYLSIEECVELNRKILMYMRTATSFNQYKRLLMNSNTLKQFNINWDLINIKAQMVTGEWDKLLDEIGNEE